MPRPPRRSSRRPCWPAPRWHFASTADAQILDRLRKRATEAAIGETGEQMDRLIRTAIRCAIDDPGCPQRARKAGKEVVYVDDAGDLITDDTRRADHQSRRCDRRRAGAAGAAVRSATGSRPTTTSCPATPSSWPTTTPTTGWATSRAASSSWRGTGDVVEWEGARWLRATANGLLAIPLPRYAPGALHARDAGAARPRQRLGAGAARARLVRPARRYRGSAVTVEMTRAGVRPAGGQGPEALAQFPAPRMREVVTPLRVMADGEHMKVYIERRSRGDVPNSVFPRGDTLFVAVSSAAAEHPVMLGAIRIAGGGRDLYDRLARDGRAATQGIYFATNSDRIRPESTPTLTEIADMLRDHPELKLRIEGHTDADGDDGYNREALRSTRRRREGVPGGGAGGRRTAGDGRAGRDHAPRAQRHARGEAAEQGGVELVRIGGAS